MTSTTTIFGPNFALALIPQIFKMFGDAVAHTYRIIWDAAWQVVVQHLLLICMALVLVLFLSAIQAFTTGRWGWFGSVLYNYLYFGTLIMIGEMFGPEIFANDYFEVVLAILYVVCFSIVSMILTGTGLRRRR